MKQITMHIWQEQYGTVTIDLPDDMDPTSNKAKEFLNTYLEEHAQDSDEGVNVYESNRVWFYDDQPEVR